MSNSGEAFSGVIANPNPMFATARQLFSKGLFSRNINENPTPSARYVITVRSPQAIFVAFDKPGGSQLVASYANALESRIAYAVRRQMIMQRRERAQYDAIDRLKFVEVPFTVKCIALAAEFTAQRTDFEIRTRVHGNAWRKIRIPSLLSRVRSVLRQHSAHDLNPTYPFRVHDVKSIDMSMQYTSGATFAVSAPDRTQWPANLPQW